MAPQLEPAPHLLPRGVLILVGMASATIAVVGLRTISGILGPVLLALVLSIAASPIRAWASRRGAPRWVGTILSVLAVYLLLALLTISLVVAAAQFASLVPDYQEELRSLLAGLVDTLRDFGVDAEQTQKILGSFDLGRIAGLVGGLLASLASVATNLAFVVTLVLFMCLDAGSFGQHLREVRAARPGFVTALESSPAAPAPICSSRRPSASSSR